MNLAARKTVFVPRVKHAHPVSAVQDHTFDRSVIIRGRLIGFCFVDAIKRFAELG